MKTRDIMERFRQRLSAKNIEMRFELRTIETVCGELADVIDFAQLMDGEFVRTPIDMAALCRELEAAAMLDQRTEEVRLDRVCHSCGHSHKDKECGMEMGQDRVCKCDVEVGA